MLLTKQLLQQWMRQTNDDIQQHKNDLTALDQPIGDGDHGTNMAKGFQKVNEQLSETTDTTVADMLKTVAMTLISTVGGASGPLLGTAFLNMSKAVKDKGDIDRALFAEAVSEAVTGIQQRGRVTRGEKTLLDVWGPVADYLSDNHSCDPAQLRQTAKESAMATKHMQASKGRAAYFAEQSIGHIDAGAMTSYYIFAALAACLEGEGV